MKNSLYQKRTFEEYLKSLDIKHEAILLIDKKGNILGSSSNLEVDLGYDDGESFPATLFEINPSFNLRSWSTLWNSLEEHKPQVLDTEHITREGIIFPIRMEVIRILKARQEIAYCRIKNLRESRVHQQLLKLTSKMSGIGGWQWDLINDSFMITDTLYKLLALPKPDFSPDKVWLEKQLREKLDQKTYSLVLNKLSRSIKEGREVKMELPLKLSETEEKVFYLRMVPVCYENKTLQLFGTVQDLSQLSNETAEMALALHTLNHTQELIYWMDESGQFIYANQTFCKRLNIDRTAIQHLSPERLFPDRDKGDIQKEWTELQNAGMISREGMMKGKGTMPFPAEFIISLFTYDQKDYACAVIRDIADRKKMEVQREIRLEKIQDLKEKLEGENEVLREEIELNFQHDGIVSQSDAYKQVLLLAEQVAPTETTVLITGETGTGKELIANTIHRLSHRSTSPFIKVNCAALPPNLIESELFGHEKGAFTGATHMKKGRFERADGGTLFLDEIGDLPLALQAKLLRVLQDGDFERVGGTRTLHVDVRVITATNRNLEKLVDQGKYRKDLYYRLNVYPIHNIPLRERKEDIPSLVRHFVDKYSKKMGKSIEKIHQSAMDKLNEYPFPGNIRELENIIERALVLSRGKVLQLSLIATKEFNVNAQEKSKRFKTLDEVQEEQILKALEHCRWKVSGKGGAAELLKINPKTLWSKMKKFGID